MKILTVPDKRLRQKAQPVYTITKVLRLQALKMLEIVGNNLGLAATQVGLDSAMFVTNYDGPRVFVNPTIIKYGLQRTEEACLSVPGVIGTVTRAREVVIQAQGLGGETFIVEETGYPAAVLQHEYDHLQGILFTDKIK